MTGVRARVRAELIAAIKANAHAQLSEHGADGLSLRAIARDLDMASSAIYRYFPSKAELLTALIVDAYEALGAAAEAAEGAVDRGDLLGRWLAASQAASTWAHEHRSEYALIFGTPVPGYAAPTDTIAAASRFTNILIAILRDAQAQRRRTSASRAPLAPRAARELRKLQAVFDPPIDETLLLAGFAAWSALFGAISFSVFGQWNNVVEDREAMLMQICTTLGHELLALPDHD